MADAGEEPRPAGEGEGEEGSDEEEEELPIHKRVDIVYCGGTYGGGWVRACACMARGRGAWLTGLVALRPSNNPFNS